MNKDLRFYLIRHGRTVWNEQGLLQGHGDSPLTEQGVQGARLAGQALRNVPLVAAYSSILQRTIDTARYILADRRVPLFQHQGLNEQFFGSWEGIVIDTIRDTEAFWQIQHDPAAYTAEINQGETYAQLAERAMGAVRDIIQVHDKGDILLVSHGHTLRLLLALFAGSTWQNHRANQQIPSLANTAINVVRYIQDEHEQNGRFIIEKINDITHLA
ncbi:histidine phosphatase family protein [Necropsobacter massiliensis]|uniref:histidine phosphatase family protein n=1 Tax=Necropsobacter massiliensis TaxID=1400001 RepID=UPI000595F5D5|nr:histidine phosphatase family protein [Necropsobacter massiliensis]